MIRKISKSLALTLVFLLLTTVFAFGADIPSDVKGKMYENAITVLVEKGIITGDIDGNFNPDTKLTRAQACIIVVKSMNPPSSEINGTATQPAPVSGFRDMAGYGWAEGYIGYAVQNGVTNGYPDGTFKPGNKVTMNEFITMVLRAAGYTDENLGGTWPLNYVGKAAELELYDLIPAPLPQYATKWMAAQFDYNALDKIEAANPAPSSPPQGTDQDKPAGVPDTKGMIFANGSFNAAMTAFDGKTISKNVVIYTYGESNNYSSTMSFSNKISDYRLDTVYKYKNVKTPAFYRQDNGKITEMVLPMDTGFSGRAYGVINGKVTALNVDDEAVTGLETLTAMNEITWLTKKGLPTPASTGAGNGYLDGTVYEMNTTDGVVQSYFIDTDAHKADVFDEISGSAFVEVEDYNDYVVRIKTSGVLFGVKENASVYILSNDKTEYTTGSLSSIRSGVGIRAYDVSDDDDSSADIIVLFKNMPF